MSRYVLQLETLWRGLWLPLGNPTSVEAASAADAVGSIESTGLRPGVLYRFHVRGPNTDARTKPAPWRDRPTGVD